MIWINHLLFLRLFILWLLAPVLDFMLRAFSFSRFFLLSALFFLPFFVGAQELHTDVREVVPAEVIEVVREDNRLVPGTDIRMFEQEVRVQLRGGERSGEVASLINEVVHLEVGDKIFVNRMVGINGVETITYADFERRPFLLFLFLVFVGMLLFFSRMQGLRALVSLVVSVLAILFVLAPMILAGYNATVSAVGVAAVVLALALFGTHGINARSIIAFIGTYSAVIITGLIAYPSVHVMRLTGFSADAAVYLNFATNGELDLTGLLLGAIIIGMLGALDDVSITQASVVQELKAANKNYTFKDLYVSASRVGRSHIGSIVNTLALAYAAISLPLILLYTQTDVSWLMALNQEVIAAEILRILVGSMGLILTVPATTFMAAWYYKNREVHMDHSDHGHSHSHSHGHGHGHHHHH